VVRQSAEWAAGAWLKCGFGSSSKDRKGTVVMDNYCVVGRFLAEIQNNKILDMMPS
jgi:hypothetical protein